MTKKNYLVSLAALAAMSIVSLSSCNNSPKEDEGGQEKGAAPTEQKIAYVEVDSLMNQYEFCKEFSVILEKKGQAIEQQLQASQTALQKDGASFQQKLQSNAYSREEAERINASLQKRASDLGETQQRLALSFQEEQKKYNDALHDSLQHFLKEYNKSKKYTLILSKSGDNILYADKAADITEEIVAGLNKAYKKGSVKE